MSCAHGLARASTESVGRLPPDDVLDHAKRADVAMASRVPAGFDPPPAR